ncbi:MAG: aliphatic sulfonate ABC transporter substrate-binding protein [Acidocella sp.]|nr:aliphatic sulfonate ABC transporter substrate-binding protein [Acidocella sp.]
MPTLNRRSLLASAVLAAPALLLGSRVAIAGTKGTLRVGYQKSSVTLVLAKAQGVLEARLNPLGYDVVWAEFPSGPPMLEALASGAVDLGYTGEPPVIFAQAAGAPLVYVAASDPSPRAVGILQPAGGKLASVKDLAGKAVAVAKGSSAHYLLVSALAHAGVPYEAVTKVFLQPADARAALEARAVDAWSVWDPFLAGAQAAGAQLLTDGTGLMPNRAYYTARRDFAAAHPEALNSLIDVLNQLEGWESQHIDATAAAISPGIGLPPEVLKTWFARQKYGVRKLTPEIFAGQQQIADTFYKLGLIPAQIDVSADAWNT